MGDVWHDFWTWPANAQLDDLAVASTQGLRQAALSQKGSADCYWLRGLVPHGRAGQNSPLATSMQLRMEGNLPLVIPEARRTAGLAGMNQLQSPARPTVEWSYLLASRSRNRAAQQRIHQRSPIQRSGCQRTCLRLQAVVTVHGEFTPTPTDLIPPQTGQLHNLVVISTGSQSRAPGRIQIQ